MKASDTISLSFRQLRERKLRTALTILAIAVGVTSIIALSSQVEGFQQGILQNLEALGPNTLQVSAMQRTSFTDADIIRILTLEGVSTVIPLQSSRVNVANYEDSITMYGLSTSDLETLLSELNVIEGSVYYDVPAPQVLLGYDIAVNDLEQLEYQTGQPIIVDIGESSITMIVVGVLEPYGSVSMISPDTAIFIPEEYMNLISRTGGYSTLIVKTESAEEVDSVSELLGYVFGGNARVFSLTQMSETVTEMTDSMNLLLMGIAGTSFIAAGLGTFNIMMISVLERTREIGMLKAIGTKDRGVLMLYMTQGVILGILGSITGLGLGSVMAYVLPLITGGGMLGLGVGGGQGGTRPGGGVSGGEMMGSIFGASTTPVLSPTILGLAVLISMTVTLLSTVYPAWKASRMSPVDALRYE
jgi:putative ABC transport system permease protein